MSLVGLTLLLMGAALVTTLTKVRHVGDEVTEIGHTLVPLKAAAELAVLEQGEEAQLFERLVRLGETLSGSETARKEFAEAAQKLESHGRQFKEALNRAEAIAAQAAQSSDTSPRPAGLDQVGTKKRSSGCARP
ncbi:MAG: hypothetical protein U1G07_08170 [Verrucomicrobiota bacterium]